MMIIKTNIGKVAVVMAMTTFLSGCNTWSRLQEWDKEPAISPITNPLEAQNYQPITQPTPPPSAGEYAGINSLWRKGSSGFFQDQRASKVGDIITVNISAKDTASLKNKTEQTRDTNKDSVNVNAIAGYEKYINKYLPNGVNAAALFDVKSDHDVTGEGKIDRSEKIDMTMAAVVTQVLPNDNLVIEGTQEIRVNYELRQLTMRGIIRRADISSANVIDSSKIAELRVSYGGRGTVSDMQQPRYGRQLIDILSPF
ncbi:MAG: flagellar basal body L-ring protein FlgH [Alphaproteobacteria bacterium]|nr:flagellar basal body L-ring protein FlgH [Alphaproteobacteria bacterium]